MNTNDDDENMQGKGKITSDCMLLYRSFYWKRFLTWFFFGSLLGISLEFISFQAMILYNHDLHEKTTSKWSLFWFHSAKGGLDIIVFYIIMAVYFMLLAYQVKNYACHQRISPNTCHFFTSLSVGMVNGICSGMVVNMGQDHAMGWRFSMGFMGQTMLTFYCAFLLACHVQRLLLSSSSSSSQRKGDHPEELLERLL